MKIVSIKISDNEKGVIETLHLEQLEAEKYKLIQTPIFTNTLEYGMVIKASINSKGELEYQTIIENSNYDNRKFMVNTIDNDLIEKFESTIINLGGELEVIFGGILIVHFPKHIRIDLNLLLDNSGMELTEFE